MRTLALIAEEEEALGRSTRHPVVFTMTRAIKSKPARRHRGIAERAGVEVIEPPLMERAALSALFEFGGDPRTIPTQGRMDRATENAALY